MLVLRLHGDLDLDGSRATRAAIERHSAGRPVLVLDLTHLEMLDSSGLALLLQLQTRPQQFRVALIAPHEDILRRIDTAGVRAMLHWVGDPSQALHDLST